MVRWKQVHCLAASFLLMLPLAGYAQTGPGDCPGMGMGPGMMMGGGWGGMGPGMMGGGWGGMGPGMMGGAGMMGLGMMGPAFALHALNLSDNQRSQINDIYSKTQTSMWDLSSQIYRERMKLAQLYNSDNPDPKQVGSIYGNLGKLNQQMAELQVGAHNRTMNLLTKEQRDQLAQWRNQWRGQGYHPGYGPGYGPGAGMGPGMMQRNQRLGPPQSEP